jgi:ABC-type amino acid transport substrate-binding protein
VQNRSSYLIFGSLSGQLLASLLVACTISTSSALAFPGDQKKPSNQSTHAAKTSPDPLTIPPELAQKTLIVGVSEQPPFALKDEDGKWAGIAVELWERIASKLNLKYEYKVTDLVGAFKGMEDHTFDVEAIPAFINDAGEKKMDFSAPYYAEDIAVAINADQQSSFLQAAHSTLWSMQFLGLLLGIAGITVAGALALWLLEHKGDSEHYKGKTIHAFGRSLYWSVSILTGRDLPSSVGWKAHPPGTRSGQIFALAWMMVGFMVFSLFTASAASLLTSKQIHGMISQWSDLKHLHVGTVDDPDSQAFLNEQHIPFTSYPTPFQMMTALYQRKVDAAVFPRSGLTYWAHHQFNDKIVILPLTSQQTYMGLPLQLGSPLRKRINLELLSIIESKSWRKVLNEYLGAGNESASKFGDGHETSNSDPESK